MGGEWQERILPRSRYFPADATVGRWLNSTPLTVQASEPTVRTIDTGAATIRKGDITYDWIGYPEFNFTLTNNHDSELVYFEARFSFQNNAGDNALPSYSGNTWEWNTSLGVGESRSYTMDDNASLTRATRFTVELIRVAWSNGQQWCSEDNSWRC